MPARLDYSRLRANIVARWRWLLTPRSFSRQGEDAACRFLRRAGYTIVDRWVRRREGEIDVVAVDGRTVVFVEVKTRRDHEAGHPAEAVDAHKQRRMSYVALAYLKRHDLLEHRARFDVVAITWPESARRPTIEHIVSAFEPPARGQMFA